MPSGKTLYNTFSTPQECSFKQGIFLESLVQTKGFSLNIVCEVFCLRQKVDEAEDDESGNKVCDTKPYNIQTYRYVSRCQQSPAQHMTCPYCFCPPRQVYWGGHALGLFNPTKPPCWIQKSCLHYGNTCPMEQHSPLEMQMTLAMLTFDKALKTCFFPGIWARWLGELLTCFSGLKHIVYLRYRGPCCFNPGLLLGVTVVRWLALIV